MRSIWKGIYQPLNLVKHLLAKASRVFRIYKRTFSISSLFVGKFLYIYNGKKFIAVKPTPLHVGHLAGEFARTRAFFVPKQKKKKVKQKRKKVKAVAKAKKKK